MTIDVWDVTMELFDLASPLDFRYYGADEAFYKRLHPYVSENSFILYQARVEAALVLALRDIGVLSDAVASEISKACAEVTADEVYEEERKIGHIVRALTNCIRRRVSPEAGRFIHLFATSNDITDTANALRLKELTGDVIIPDLLGLQEALAQLALGHAETPQIGRTHGMHAEPITFGFAIALYVDRLGGRIKRIETARQELRGKFAGAVGAYNAISLQLPEKAHLFERLVLSYLGLRPSDNAMASQIVQPEYVTDLAYAATSCFSVLANYADDMRHLHRSELGEIEEGQATTGVGSSTMPHKNNPKNFELVKSLWKAYMPRMMTSLSDQISEHQRDLSNSASSRFLTEMLTAFDYCIHRLTKSVKQMRVNTTNIARNLAMSGDSIIAEPLYILLALGGHPRAYDAVRALVASAKERNEGLADVAWNEPDLKPYLKNMSTEQQAILKNPSNYTGLAKEQTVSACEQQLEVAAVLKSTLAGERQILKDAAKRGLPRLAEGILSNAPLGSKPQGAPSYADFLQMLAE